MAVKDFLKWPDKRLRSRAHEIAEITEEIISIWNDMVDTFQIEIISSVISAIS